MPRADVTSRLEEIASSAEPKLVWSRDGQPRRHLWFKTKPLEKPILLRVLQLQLITLSSDQGWVDGFERGGASWFELVIYENAETRHPRRVKDGKELVFESHNNTLALKMQTTQFGVVFTRSDDFFAELQPGNVIGVRVCARHQLWSNRATSGRLVAMLLDDKLFAAAHWSLNLEDVGSFIATSAGAQCHIRDRACSSETWFQSPPLEQSIIDKLVQIQLFANAWAYVEDTERPWEGQDDPPAWFELFILRGDSPMMKDGMPLQWRSHTTPAIGSRNNYIAGRKFGKDDEPPQNLKMGDVIAVRICAEGWAHYAQSGRLVLRTLDSSRAAETVAAKENTPADEAAARGVQTAPNRTLIVNASGLKDALQYPYSAAFDTLMRYGDLRDSVPETKPGGRHVRLLAIDGGGIRGVSALTILSKIQETMRANDVVARKPCEYFDIIAGTSTGGLIAIMLGRLKMSIQDCMNEYSRLSETVFRHSWATKILRLLRTGYFFGEAALEEAIKDVIRANTDPGNPDALMNNPDLDACKVFVVACHDRDDKAVHMSTYAQINNIHNITIWQAARATSAAPFYFPPMPFEERVYSDGGTGFNNPSLELYLEALLLYGSDRPFLLVSIGTGISTAKGNPNHWKRLGLRSILTVYDFISNLVTNTSRTHDALKPIMDGTRRAHHRYFRFDVDDSHSTGVKIPPLDAWREMETYVRATEAFLDGDEVKQRIDECANALMQDLLPMSPAAKA